ncbi:MAG: hypothetical protein ACMUIL_05120 [bacterium]
MIPATNTPATGRRSSSLETGCDVSINKLKMLSTVYDVDFAVAKLDLDIKKPRFMDLVKKKLHVPDNDPVDTSYSRKSELDAQLDTQLKPTLRQQDFEGFDLNRAFVLIAEMGSGIIKE